jgi:hypothetical protein
MKSSFVLNSILGFTLVFSLFVSSSICADSLLITRHFSGIWDQPRQESQGIILQIGEQDGDKKIGIAYWFTYGDDLQSSWYLGVGPVTDNKIHMALYQASDIGFMAENLPGNANVEQIGTLDLVFKNCNHGIATYDTPQDVIGAGDFPIKRISSIYRTRCSGGISDDTRPEHAPLQLEVKLFPPTDSGSGEGKAKFWERPDRSDFKVEAEDIPDGNYTLEVCLEPRGEMLVSAGEGEIVFRSPATDSTLLLDFNPRDCAIELINAGGEVVLSSGDYVLGQERTKREGHEHNNEGHEVEVEFNNIGIIEGAKGAAELELEHGDRAFSVKIKDVPAGFYGVDVSGSSRGEIEVVEQQNGKLVGKIKFSDPQKDDTLELNFDPRGQLIEIRQLAVDGAPVILEVLFPDE